MKFYKLISIIKYFIQRSKKQFGIKRWWERKDPQAISPHSWEFCMFQFSLRKFEINIGLELRKALFEAMNKLPNLYENIRPMIISEPEFDNIDRIRMVEHLGYTAYDCAVFKDAVS